MSVARNDSCPRDWYGYCQIALYGHRLCPVGDGVCRVEDKGRAWDQVRDRVNRRAFAEWHRRWQARAAGHG